MSTAKSLPKMPSILLSGRRQASPLSQVGASDMPMCRRFGVLIVPISCMGSGAGPALRGAGFSGRLEGALDADAEGPRLRHARLDAADPRFSCM